MANSSVAVIDLDERDQAIFEARLAGKSVRQLARQHRLTMAQVDDIVATHLVPETVEEQARAKQIELARLDVCQNAIHDKVRAGNVAAVMASVKIGERQAAIRGSDAPLKLDPIQLLQAAQPVTTTDKIQRVLDELAAHKRLSGPEIEHEVEGKPVDE
jgi:hypothetical protein